MNIRLQDFNKYLTIAGFKDAKIKDLIKLFQDIKNKTGNACVQLFDASTIAGSEHLRFAALNALKAFESRINISTSLSMEMLLYASAQRQIKEALALVGIKPSTRSVAVLILTDSAENGAMVLETVANLLGGRQDNGVLDLTDEKISNLRRIFGISDTELKAKIERKGAVKQAMTDLVVEHMALLVTQL